MGREKNESLTKADTLLQKRERERERERENVGMIDDYINFFDRILRKLIDMSGTMAVAAAWSQTLNKVGEKYPFLKNAVVDLIINEKYPILKKKEESLSEYKSVPSLSVKMIDLDVGKLYLDTKNMDEDYLRKAFEETLEIFYTIGKILFGSTVKFPLVLDEEEI